MNQQRVTYTSLYKNNIKIMNLLGQETALLHATTWDEFPEQAEPPYIAGGDPQVLVLVLVPDEAQV